MRKLHTLQAESPRNLNPLLNSKEPALGSQSDKFGRKYLHLPLFKLSVVSPIPMSTGVASTPGDRSKQTHMGPGGLGVH